MCGRVLRVLLALRIGSTQPIALPWVVTLYSIGMITHHNIKLKLATISPKGIVSN